MGAPRSRLFPMSPRRTITFDFHDTLASCDAWFELEVRSLPGSVVERLAAGTIQGGPVPTAEAIMTTYRDIRGEIVGHGIEMDAVAGVEETFRRHGLRADRDAVAGVIDDLMRGALEGVRPKPGSIETVRSLSDEGFTLGVVSSAVHHPFLLWVLEAFAILPLFATVVTSASAGFYKSRPEIYHRALDDLGADASSTCHVGDSLRWDHLMAKSIGMRTVLVSTGKLELGAEQPAPDLHLSSLVNSAPEISAVAIATARSSTRR